MKVRSKIFQFNRGWSLSAAALTLILLFASLNIHSHAFDSSIGDIDIEAKNLDVDTKAKTAAFFGNVVVQQDNIKIFTDKLTIFFQNKEIEKIDFFNNVKFQMHDKIVVGGRAEYVKNNNILKITDNVKYKDDNKEITGDIFTYNLKTKISKLSSKKEDNRQIKGRIKIKFKVNKNVSSCKLI